MNVVVLASALWAISSATIENSFALIASLGVRDLS